VLFRSGRLSFDNILKAGLRAKGMIRQILDFSRPAEENRHPLQVESIIKEAMKLLRPSLPTTIEIRVNVAATGPVLADPSQIHQMLMNLCANAAYAMREKGGVLEVGLQETALDDRTATRYAELKPGRYVRLSVSDTGQGMDHQTLERIFEPFFTTKRPGEGTGMGLAVVHNIVRSHHGQINVYSEPGQGAVFNVYLPLLERPEAEAGGPETGAIPQGRERILFVDDEEMLVGLGQALLSRLGYQVTALTSSLKALEIFRSDPQAFDLLLTDQTMPHLTGLQLAQQVLRLRPDLPVILCSGFSETVNAESALAAGVKAFAMKPLSLRDIAATIRQALGPAPPPPQAKAGEA
jgi:CheY-like chemotaxis protein